jgi:RNA polymerase sigma-70 factor (ECF subfamily)
MQKDQAQEPGEGPAEEPVPLSDEEFKVELGRVIPHLRAFGRSLSGNRDLADDLVQETLLKAWAARKRFQAGTNMRAWTFIILRCVPGPSSSCATSSSRRCAVRVSRASGTM